MSNLNELLQSNLVCPLAELMDKTGENAVIPPKNAVAIFSKDGRSSLVVNSDNLQPKWASPEEKRKHLERVKETLLKQKFRYDPERQAKPHEQANDIAWYYAGTKKGLETPFQTSWLKFPEDNNNAGAVEDLFLKKLRWEIRRAICSAKNVDPYGPIFGSDLKQYLFEILPGSENENSMMECFAVWIFKRDPRPQKIITKFIESLSKSVKKQNCDDAALLLDQIIKSGVFIGFFKSILITKENHELIIFALNKYWRLASYNQSAMNDEKLFEAYYSEGEPGFKELGIQFIVDRLSADTTLLEKVARKLFNLLSNSIVADIYKWVWFSALIKAGLDPNTVLEFNDKLNSKIKLLDDVLKFGQYSLIEWMFFGYFDLKAADLTQEERWWVYQRNRERLTELMALGASFSPRFISTLSCLPKPESNGLEYENLKQELLSNYRAMQEAFLCYLQGGDVPNGLSTEMSWYYLENIEIAMKTAPGALFSSSLPQSQLPIHAAIMNAAFSVIVYIIKQCPQSLLHPDNTGKLPCELMGEKITQTRTHTSSEMFLFRSQYEKTFVELIQASLIEAIKIFNADAMNRILECWQKHFPSQDEKVLVRKEVLISELILKLVEPATCFTIESIRWLLETWHVDFLKLRPCLSKWLTNLGFNKELIEEQWKLLDGLCALVRVSLNNNDNKNFILHNKDFIDFYNQKTKILKKWLRLDKNQNLTWRRDVQNQAPNQTKFISGVIEQILRLLDMDFLNLLSPNLSWVVSLLEQCVSGARDMIVLVDMLYKLSLKVKKPLRDLFSECEDSPCSFPRNRCFWAISDNQSSDEFKVRLLRWLIGHLYINRGYSSQDLKAFFSDNIVDLLIKEGGKASAMIELEDSVIKYLKEMCPPDLILINDLRDCIGDFSVSSSATYERGYGLANYVRAMEELCKIHALIGQCIEVENKEKEKKLSEAFNALLYKVSSVLIRYCMSTNSLWMRTVYDVTLEGVDFVLTINKFDSNRYANPIMYRQVIEALAQYCTNDKNLKAAWPPGRDGAQFIPMNSIDKEKIHIQFSRPLKREECSKLLMTLRDFGMVPEKLVKSFEATNVTATNAGTPVCSQASSVKQDGGELRCLIM